MTAAKSPSTRPSRPGKTRKAALSTKALAGLARRTESDEEHVHGLQESALRLEEIAEEIRERDIEQSREIVAGLDHSGPPLKHRLRALDKGPARRQLLRALHSARDDEIERILEAGELTWEKSVLKGRGKRFGAGFDERMIEIPLAIECAAPQVPGRVLDAGAALNLPRFRSHLSGRAAFVHFTQSGEAEPAQFDGGLFSYLFGDLRELPFRDHHFDRVLCISTLEHVGMDNERYGGPAEKSSETWRRAVEELVRVLAKKGTLMISVPCGRARDLGWYRVFGGEEIEELEDALAPLEVATRYFAYDAGWFDSKPKRMVELDDDPSVIRGVAVVRARGEG